MVSTHDQRASTELRLNEELSEQRIGRVPATFAYRCSITVQTPAAPLIDSSPVALLAASSPGCRPGRATHGRKRSACRLKDLIVSYHIAGGTPAADAQAQHPGRHATRPPAVRPRHRSRSDLRQRAPHPSSRPPLASQVIPKRAAKATRCFHTSSPAGVLWCPDVGSCRERQCQQRQHLWGRVTARNCLCKQTGLEYRVRFCPSLNTRQSPAFGLDESSDRKGGAV